MLRNIPQTIELQDRDIRMFEVLAQTKAMTPTAAGLHYQTSKYHYRRLGHLVAHDYLEKMGNLYTLGPKGARAIGIPKPRISVFQLKHWAMASDVNVRLKDFKCVDNSLIRVQYNQNREVKYKFGMRHLYKPEVLYFAYFLPNNTAQKAIASICHEMNYLVVSNIATHFVVFTPVPAKIWQSFKDVPNAHNVLVLPHPWGIQILEYLHSDEFEETVKSHLVNPRRSDTALAEWKTDDGYFVNLLGNNAYHRGLLHRYGTQGHKVTAFCLSQAIPDFEYQMPDVDFIGIDIPGIEIPANITANSSSKDDE